MQSDQPDRIPRLGPLTLGASFAIYSFMQYFFTPIAWWAAQRTDALSWMNDLFIYFDFQGLDPFTGESLLYALFGLAAFGVGYTVISAKIPPVRSTVVQQSWPFKRAEHVFWVLFLAGFGLKAFRLWMGADVSGSATRSVFGDSSLSFFIWLNWLHLAGLCVINIAYQEAASRKDVLEPRLRALAYGTNVLVLGVSLLTASRMTSFAPLASLVIIRQYYKPLSAATLLRRGAVLVVLLLVFKALLMASLLGESPVTGADHQARDSLFYTLFHRVNLSWVLAEVIEGGQQAYPDGTLSQFFNDILPSGMQSASVFDGNEFGRELALIQDTDTLTGVAVTNIGDLYINGGIAGIGIGMLLIGTLYRMLVTTCQPLRPASVLIYASMWPLCIHGTESPVSVLCAGALKMLALCMTVHVAITAFGAEEPVLPAAVPRVGR